MAKTRVVELTDCEFEILFRFVEDHQRYVLPEEKDWWEQFYLKLLEVRQGFRITAEGKIG